MCCSAPSSGSVEARQHELDMTQLKRRMALTKDLGTLRQSCLGENAASPDVQKLLAAWIELTGAVATLIGGNKKIQDDLAEHSGDVAAWLQTQREDLAILTTLVSTRQRLIQSSHKVIKLRELLARTLDEQSCLVELAPPDTLSALLELEEFDDIVGFKASDIVKQLEGMSAKILSTCAEKCAAKHKDLAKKEENNPWAHVTDPFNQLATGGDSDWKKDLDAEASLDDVMQAAKPTLLALLPGPALKQFAESAEEDILRAKQERNNNTHTHMFIIG